MLFSYENLYRHYLKCRRNKRNTVNALRFEARQEENLLELQESLLNRTYRPGRSVCFVTSLDRLMHRSHLIEFEGKSYRLKEATTRLAQNPSVN